MSELRFRGLDAIADATFERATSNCSQCVPDSCRTRDCQLNVYQLDSDRIFSGGICPKGNTGITTKKAPNYVQRYRKRLEDSLEKITIPLESSPDNERILIPRSLTFLNERGVFQAALYHSLGFDVSISPESNDEIANLGEAHAHPESCFPIKLAHGHTAYLSRYLRSDKDKLLLINTIGGFESGRRTRFCPYVASQGHVIQGNLRLPNQDVLIPVVRFDDSCYSLNKAIKKDLDRVFPKRKFSEEKVKAAIARAAQKQEDFLQRVRKEGEEIVSRLKEKGEDIFIGIGRGYTILDDKASSRVHELFAEKGLHFLPAFFLSPRQYDIEEISPNMYWLQGRRMIIDNLRVIQEPNMFPVRATNFNCGTDSILLHQEQDIMQKAEKPHLVLETDGHNSNAQFGTRTAAFNEVVIQTPKKSVDLEKLCSTPVKVSDLEERIIGIPYMGDNADILVAAFRASGFNAVVMPTRTDQSLARAEEFVTTNTCRPFAFQIGDHLAWLDSQKAQGLDPNQKAAVVLPGADGPCRFGQYRELLRKFLARAGFSKVPVVSPAAHEDYSDAISKTKTPFTSLVYMGIFANDVLYNALLRTRPYEVNQGDSEKVYRQAHLSLVKLIESNSTLKKLETFQAKQATIFKTIKKTGKRKPIAAKIGEIFVRCHEQANQDSIRVLENQGLEVMLAPVSEWMDYINRTSIRRFNNERNKKKLVKSLIKRAKISYASWRLFRPFSQYLKGREFHNPLHLVDKAERDFIFDSTVAGESPITVATVYAFAKGKLPYDGIYHVSPFGCMQETVATSRVQSLLQDIRKTATKPHEKVLPYMDAVFGESELPNLEAQIAIFAQNCQTRMELRLEECAISN